MNLKIIRNNSKKILIDNIFYISINQISLYRDILHRDHKYSRIKALSYTECHHG